MGLHFVVSLNDSVDLVEQMSLHLPTTSIDNGIDVEDQHDDGTDKCDLENLFPLKFLKILFFHPFRFSFFFVSHVVTILSE